MLEVGARRRVKRSWYDLRYKSWDDYKDDFDSGLFDGWSEDDRLEYPDHRLETDATRGRLIKYS